VSRLRLSPTPHDANRRKAVNIAPTELNQRLSNAVRNRLAAESFAVAGQAGFFRIVGLGLMAFGVGAALGIGFYGYSFISRNSDNMKILSSTFSQALSEAELRGTAVGTVQLKPNELSLAKGQTVSLDNQARVLLDPKSVVTADGELRVQAPSVSAPQNIAPRSTSNVPNITNFTVFKTVPFEKGSVMTGWMFLTSAQRSPTNQYCYYTEDADTPGLKVSFDLGEDRVPKVPKTTPKGFDPAAAFGRCVWFNATR
jgi:hypothetical protein